MSKKKRILITNDDGITGRGLDCLIRRMKGLGKVFTVVPDRPMNASGHSLTLHRPLYLDRLGPDLYTVNGTPADCVRMGAIHIMGLAVDLVVSGINMGPNLGYDIFYSGTVAAAREGTICGFTSMAVSLASVNGRYFETAASVSYGIAKRLLKKGLKGFFLNVNVPDLPLSRLKPSSITVPGSKPYSKEVSSVHSPSGKEYFWIGGREIKRASARGTDVYAVKNGSVSITPVCLTMTGPGALEEVRRRTW